MPRLAPIRAADSYSTMSVTWWAYVPVRITPIWLQRIGQPKQAALPRNRCLCWARSPSRSASGSTWSMWLRTGSTPISDAHSTLELVPPSVRARHSALAAMAARASRQAARKASRSCTRTVRDPCTAMPLRFLAPMTAPAPPRPAWRLYSQLIRANGSRFSPPWPMVTTMACGAFRAFLMASLAASEPWPQMDPAGRMVTVSSSIHR